MMMIRTTATFELNGREVRAGLFLSLPADQAQTLIDDGLAEPWAPDGAVHPMQGAAPEADEE